MYALAFFCDLSRHSGVSSPKDILIQLVSQLMLKHPRLTPAILGDDPYKLNEAGVEKLTTIFTRLLRNLPGNSTVYCMIDAFDPSSKSRVGDADDLLGRVLKIIGQVSQTGTTRLKIVFTTPKSGLGFAKHFRKSETLDLGLSKRGARKGSARPMRSRLGHAAAGWALDEAWMEKY